MTRLFAGIWDRLRLTHRARRRPTFSNLRMRPRLEVLEDRTTPSGVTASAALNGSVFFGSGSTGIPGVDVTLTGITTTGRSVDVSTTTDTQGAFHFTQLFPGTYGVARVAPGGFVNGSQTGVSGIALAQGQTVSGINLTVPGLAPSEVSLAYFLSEPGPARFTLPPAGSGSGVGFSLDSATSLGAQTINTGTTHFLDLAGNFIDPNTVNGTVVAFHTSLGTVNIKLFDKDAPQTVTNFLNYLQAGGYTSDVFQRLSSLRQVSPINPPLTPFQVLQGGGFSVNSDTSGNVTGFNTVPAFQPIQNESNDALHPNAVGTLAMARSSNLNSATSEFFFNLTDNTQALAGNPGSGFAVFGAAADSASLSILQQFAAQYTPSNQSAVNSNFFALPLINGFTPASNFPTGATTADLALTNSATVVQPPTGQLTYTILSNSNPNVVTATLGSNNQGSTFSANQLQLVGTSSGTAVITIQVTDIKGESVLKQFTVTVR